MKMNLLIKIMVKGEDIGAQMCYLQKIDKINQLAYKYSVELN